MGEAVKEGARKAGIPEDPTSGLGKDVIEAGIETPIPSCPWQTSHCEKVLELVASDRRCQDCPVRWRLLGISEQLTASDGALRLEVQYDRDLSG